MAVSEGVSGERGKIGEEGPEAVDRKAILGPAGGLLGDGGAGALGFGRFLVGVAGEHGARRWPMCHSR